MTNRTSFMLALAAMIAAPAAANPSGGKACPVVSGQAQDCDDVAGAAGACAKGGGVIRNPSSQSGQTLRTHSDSDTAVAGKRPVTDKHAINTKGTGAAGRTELAIKTKGTGAQREDASPKTAPTAADCNDTSAKLTG